MPYIPFKILYAHSYSLSNLNTVSRIHYTITILNHLSCTYATTENCISLAAWSIYIYSTLLLWLLTLGSSVYYIYTISSALIYEVTPLGSNVVKYFFIMHFSYFVCFVDNLFLFVSVSTPIGRALCFTFLEFF